MKIKIPWLNLLEMTLLAFITCSLTSTNSTASSMSMVEDMVTAFWQFLLLFDRELGYLNQVGLVGVCSKFQLSSLCRSFQAN